MPAARRMLSPDEGIGGPVCAVEQERIPGGAERIEKHHAHRGRPRRLCPYLRRPCGNLTPPVGKIGRVLVDVPPVGGDAVGHESGGGPHGGKSLGLRGFHGMCWCSTARQTKHRYDRETDENNT